MPAIIKPTSFSFVSLALTIPTNSPLLTTAILSDTFKTSSNSRDTNKTAFPKSLCSTNLLWIYSIEPTSSPLVGWTAIKKSGLDSISRPITPFCWLPPDKDLAIDFPPSPDLTSNVSIIFCAYSLIFALLINPLLENGFFL